MDFLPDIIPIKEDDYEILEFNGDSMKWESKIQCKFKREEEILDFVEEYKILTNEELKVKLRKPETDKGKYVVRIFYRCVHNTRYEKTREDKKILNMKLYKRFKNTYCPFQMSFKILKP